MPDPETAAIERALTEARAVIVCDDDGRHERATIRELAPRQPYKP